ncbi:hypothetical protein DFH06DRAFT_1339425 [Mycena polygramma]|nr:hypothetical protein DFH06DRAFT_1339425 [Mycena polygramma]
MSLRPSVLLAPTVASLPSLSPCSRHLNCVPSRFVFDVGHLATLTAGIIAFLTYGFLCPVFAIDRLVAITLLSPRRRCVRTDIR